MNLFDRSPYLDWSDVADPVADDALRSLLTEERMRDRWFNLSKETRSVHRLILESFVQCARPPTPQELSELRLGGIVRARRLSLATMRNIRQNLFFAMIYNTAGVPIAAGILYPFFGLLISPMFAAAAMSLSSVSVIGNALRLRGVQL